LKVNALYALKIKYLVQKNLASLHTTSIALCSLGMPNCVSIVVNKYSSG